MRKYLRIALVIVLSLLLLMMAGCKAEDATKTKKTEPTKSVTKNTYVVSVENAAGKALPMCRVEVYEGTEKSNRVYFGLTGKDGQVQFTAPAGDYTVYIVEAPTGYATNVSYPVTGERTKVVLSPGTMEDGDFASVKYGLGDAMLDFSVTTPDGTEYTLSQMLQERSAVVLNFWFLGCDPCKMEFPYLQEAYSLLSDDVMVLALNPMDGDNASVEAFQQENGYTFPMAKCDSRWMDVLGLESFPTTLVIDRYGNICLMHRGMVTETQEFLNMFGYFIGDDYEQTFFESAVQLPTYVPENSAENPLVLSGGTSFDVNVGAGEKLYVDVFGVGGMNLTVENENVSVIYNGETYRPVDGVVKLNVSSMGPFMPASLTICNDGVDAATYKLDFSYVPGSLGAPFDLPMGSFTVQLEEGQDVGVYYRFVAEEAGTLTIRNKPSDGEVDYDCSVYNLNSFSQITLDEDGVVDAATGDVVLTMEVQAGDEININVFAYMTNDGIYPAVTIQLEASL